MPSPPLTTLLKSLLSDLRNQSSAAWQAVQTWQRRRMALGARGERLAVHYLRWRKRMYIIEASARSTFGEIDIIAVDRQRKTVIFVEVKTRRSHDAGSPASAVTERKQRQVAQLALAYLKHHNLLDSCSVRFDVIAITWPATDWCPKLVHYESAFDSPLA